MEEGSIIDQSLDRISRIIDKLWLSIYPRPRKFIFNNGSEFKRNFILFLKDFSFKPTCTTIKHQQSNDILERIHQFVGSMLKTKGLSNTTVDAVSLWIEIIAPIAYAVL